MVRYYVKVSSHFNEWYIISYMISNLIEVYLNEIRNSNEKQTILSYIIVWNEFLFLKTILKISYSMTLEQKIHFFFSTTFFFAYN